MPRKRSLLIRLCSVPEDLFERIAACVEFGKINQVSPYPPAMKGQPGAEELTVQALEENVSPSDILTKGLILGMERIGLKFKENKVFVPQVLMSAKAMGTAMKHLKPFFNDGTVQRKGQMIEGNGYEVIDLGVDVKVDQYLEAIRQHPNAYVGMSALLTTTMMNMEVINAAIKKEFPNVITFVGGAPVTADFAKRIGVDYYTDGPQELSDEWGSPLRGD